MLTTPTATNNLIEAIVSSKSGPSLQLTSTRHGSSATHTRAARTCWAHTQGLYQYHRAVPGIIPDEPGRGPTDDRTNTWVEDVEISLFLDSSIDDVNNATGLPPVLTVCLTW